MCSLCSCYCLTQVSDINETQIGEINDGFNYCSSATTLVNFCLTAKETKGRVQYTRSKVSTHLICLVHPDLELLGVLIIIKQGNEQPRLCSSDC